jgi:hypothetical protein
MRLLEVKINWLDVEPEIIYFGSSDGNLDKILECIKRGIVCNDLYVDPDMLSDEEYIAELKEEYFAPHPPYKIDQSTMDVLDKEWEKRLSDSKLYEEAGMTGLTSDIYDKIVNTVSECFEEPGWFEARIIDV